MADISISLESHLERELRLRAAQHGRSMEDEARHILNTALTEQGKPVHKPVQDLFSAIRRRIAPFGGVDLEIPRRGPRRFDE